MGVLRLFEGYSLIFCRSLNFRKGQGKFDLNT